MIANIVEKPSDQDLNFCLKLMYPSSVEQGLRFLFHSFIKLPL